MIANILPVYIYIALASAFLSGFGVWKVADWRCDAARTAAVERTIQQMQVIEEQNDAISSRFENDRVKVRTEFKVIYDALDSTPGPSSAECKFPTAWVWAWHAANNGSAKTPGKPADGVPYSSAAYEPRAEGAVPEPYLGGAGVPRVSGETQSPDRVGKGWFE